MALMGLGEIGSFRFWVQKVLPAVYDDSLSYYELLSKVIDKLNEIIEKGDYDTSTIEQLAKALTELQGEFEKFKESGFEDYYEQQVNAWITENLEYIFTETVKQVYFGLNLEGYFVAYIPDGWDDIVFDTGYVYGIDTYGRLILRWDVDDSGESVNQRPEDWS